MSQNQQVQIRRRFLRSIRIDSDLSDPKALQGFVCPQSFINVFETMMRHLTETGQSAFSWTGPYGSGKSSLALSLCSMLSTDRVMRKQTERIFSSELRQMVRTSLPLKNKGWHLLPVVGRRDDPVLTFGESLKTHRFVSKKPSGGWTEKNLIEKLVTIATSKQEEYGGLIVIVDEMGKFLEAATQFNTDIYFFQQLAEAAARSNGRLLVIGILHQAFQEYSNKLSSELRDEWVKIQGRYIDISVSVTSDEQIDLIARAIQTKGQNRGLIRDAQLVADLIYGDNQPRTLELKDALLNCWPLHPATARLLCAISRRRFGQNQRSLFGFLNSAEPFGFQDFLNRRSYIETYRLVHLWDYLKVNLEPSILASPDGHRWALAAEALERCEYSGGKDMHTEILKTIAVIDLFKESSGLLATKDLLVSCLPSYSPEQLERALEELQRWSLILYKKYVEAFAIFAGSDFDIESAVNHELSEIRDLDCSKLEHLVNLQPIVAKRHYHETGSLRWFDVRITSLADLPTSINHFKPNNSRIGQFLLVVPTEGESEMELEETCNKLLLQLQTKDSVLGLSSQNWSMISFAKELVAVENVKNNYAELSGDSVARREVQARFALLENQVENHVLRAIDSATWLLQDSQRKQLKFSSLATLASELADEKYCMCPILHNELVNRQRPSGSAVGARNHLLRRMVMNCGEPRLGISGYPAEGGLFMSILEATRLYSGDSNSWKFVAPPEDDSYRLAPMWESALKLIKKSNVPVKISEIYRIWKSPPYGIKSGLLPILVIAFIQSQKENIAIYREGIFRPQFDDVDVDYLAKDPDSVQLRWLQLSDEHRMFLSSLAEIVEQLDSQIILDHLLPLNVAQGLVKVFDLLPNFTKRTMRMSANTVELRELLKRSNDPNKLLFDDLPAFVRRTNGDSEEFSPSVFALNLHSTFQELVQTYSTMLAKLRDTMLSELQVPNDMAQSLKELRNRAINIKQLTGDFRIEAFVGRITTFDGSEEAFEGIASLAANKPSRDWIDLDVDRALVNIAEMSRSFLRAETYARVKGREEKRQAISVMFGTQHNTTPITDEFYVGDTDQSSIDSIIKRIEDLLNESDEPKREVVLAALAEVCTKYIREKDLIGGEVINE